MSLQTWTAARRTRLRVEPLEDRTQPAGGLLAEAAIGGGPGVADPVLYWNRVAQAVHVVDHTPGDEPGSGAFVQGGPTGASRAFAMVQGAVFDAVNAITPTYTPYLLTQTFAPTASKRAAVAVAAHDTLVSLFPGQAAAIDNVLRVYLATVPNGFAENEGIRAGRAAAAAMLAARENDGADAMIMYMPGDQPGEHRPDPLHPDQGFLGPQWGEVVPFTLNAGGGTDEFLAPPPPALDSPEYAAAFNEVKVLGAADAETADRDGNGLPDRTHEQTTIGTFWGYDGTRGLGTPPRLYNQIAQKLAVQEHNTLLENARLFALFNLAMADGGIQCWDTKYEYNFWRPILGIREADAGTGPSGLGDNNPDTAGEAGWEPLGAPNTNAPAGSSNFTPPFPAYGSGHATFGATLFRTLARFYGRDDIRFTFVSDEFNGRNRDVDGHPRPRIARTFDSFSEAAEENGQSRIYLGIHWSFDKTGGIAGGNRIADFVFDNFLRPLPAVAGGGKSVGHRVAAPPSWTSLAPATVIGPAAGTRGSIASVPSAPAAPPPVPVAPLVAVSMPTLTIGSPEPTESVGLAPLGL
ncbi:MAG TPA: hypothetical protein VKD90_10890 [Gemmataceae bacterium]|nr:hypothetical protein [Gemmataceae bacterium]